MDTEQSFKRVKGPWPDVPPARRRVMQGNKAKDTKPEMHVRRLLHGLGYRFRLHRRDLPGRPDLVFPSRRAVIQIYGCFWHQHPGCGNASIPKSRQGYWVPKFEQNAKRDRESERALAGMGWRVLVVWECEVADRGRLLERLQGFLGPPGRAGGRPG